MSHDSWYNRLAGENVGPADKLKNYEISTESQRAEQRSQRT
jgi:hypothetical protein